MLRSSLVFGIAFLSLFTSFSALADTTVVEEKRVIISPVPKAVCSLVQGRWEGNTWIAPHNVCKYENRSEGVAWVSEYWSCTEAKEDGTCVAWTLVPGHWVKTLE